MKGAGVIDGRGLAGGVVAIDGRHTPHMAARLEEGGEGGRLVGDPDPDGFGNAAFGNGRAPGLAVLAHVEFEIGDHAIVVDDLCRQVVQAAKVWAEPRSMVK